MGQQMSGEDQDEGFKSIISRMLQEADNEESDTITKTTPLKILENGEKTSSEETKNENETKNKTEESENENVIKNEICSKKGEHSEKDRTENIHGDLKTSSENLESTDGNKTPSDVQEIKLEANLSNENSECFSDEKNLKNEVKKLEDENNDLRTEGTEGQCNRTEAEAQRTDSIEKAKRLETVFLKDRIDNLINTCLSSKSFEADLELKRNSMKSALNKSQTALPLVKQENCDIENRNNHRQRVSQDDFQRTSQNYSENSKKGPQNSENQNQRNSNDLHNEQEVRKERNSGSRETTTFQTLIEKVLDNSLAQPKTVESSQNSSRQDSLKQVPVNENFRLENVNQLHTIKNEMRNELLVKDSNERPRLEAKQDDMSINRSKVVYLKDHIERVLEKSFQNSSRKDHEEVPPPVSERPVMRYEERHQQNKEFEHRPLVHRERSHSLVGEQIRQRDRNHSFSIPGASSELKRHRSLEAYDLEHLGPPKLIKVTEIYPDMGRETGRYLQPPRIDTYDGNSRGSYKSSHSPGGSFSRSPLDQSPVSPYYNHSPNSWHGHSPRDQQHVIPSNHSPNHSVPSAMYHTTRYPVTHGTPYPPNVTMSRYNNGTHVHPSQLPATTNNRGFQPPYPQTGAHPSYMTTSHDVRYPGGNPQMSPAAQHPSRNYPHLPPRPMVNSVQTFPSEEIHSKQQVSPGQLYQQMSPRQPPYPSNHPQISPTLRPHPPYPTQGPHQVSRTMIPSGPQYPQNIDNNPNYPPVSNMHHARPQHPNFPPQGMQGRNNNVGYMENASAMRQRIPLQRPHYNVEGPHRNPPVSSAMALGPVPPQNYYKQQSQKPPQLFPSSPPIPSVREFTINSNRGSNQPPYAVRPEPKQPEIYTSQHRDRNQENTVNTRPPVTAHEQAPVLDLSVKKDDSASLEPDMQPLDLTCKPKTDEHSAHYRQYPSGKGLSGFEYLAHGSREKTPDKPCGTYTPKQNHIDAQYSRGHGSYSEYDVQNKDFMPRHSGELTAGSHGYSPQQVAPGQNSHHGYKQNVPTINRVTISPQNTSFNEDNGHKVQGQSTINQNSQSQQESKKAASISRHEPIQNILGTHSPTDILYLICRLCGQTYGSPYGFRKHFRNQHGFEPRAEHTIVQTISETKTALQSPPANPQAFLVAQPPNPVTGSNMDESHITVAQNPTSISQESNYRPSSRLKADENTESRPSSINTKDESVGNISERFDESSKREMEEMQNTGNRKCLECHECGQTFQLNDFGAYKRHCRQHGHPKTNNPFDPSFSNEQQTCNTISSENIKNRENMSTEISLICKECNIPFASELFLKEHMDTIHPHSADFKCSSCKENFTDVKLYENHLKTVHLDGTESKVEIYNVKKRIIGDFQKNDFEYKEDLAITSTRATKSAADSMVTTASPDSSSDMVRKTSGTDSLSDAQTANLQPQSDKHSSESDSNNENKMELSRQTSCDSAMQKNDDSVDSDNMLYLHKKFGTKRKFISSSNNDTTDTKLTRKDLKSPVTTGSPNVVSTNSCDSDQSYGKTEINELDQETNVSSVDMEGSDDGKGLMISGKCSVTNKTEARHQLPFVWDRVTRSQVGRKPTKNN